MRKKVIGFCIFSVIYALISLLLLFYLDLANGPLVLLFVEIAILIGGIVVRILFRDKKFFLRNVVWIGLLVLNIPVFLLAKPAFANTRAVSNEKSEQTEVLSLKSGDVVGLYNDDKTVQVYAGIPYAKPPVGELRWKEPQDVEHWDGVKECFYFAPRAYQSYGSSIMDTLVEIYSERSWHPDYNMHPRDYVSEDCLYLNIWKPNTTEKNLPIIIYIHGGSLTSGSSYASDINGETFAKNGVIMITVAYRLGIFGYYAHEDLASESENGTTGNYGLLDQIKALKWVSENAECFGGDKNNITIAGESAGSSSVSAICSSPLAKGLFKNAIGESSSVVVIEPPHTYRTYESAIATGHKIMEEFSCSTIEDMRKLDAGVLVQTKYSNSSMTLDGYALTKNPYEVYRDKENNETNLLNGYNIKEADAFVIPQNLFTPVNKDNIKDRLISVFGQTYAEKIMTLYSDRIQSNAFEAYNEIISVYWFIYPHHSWSKMAMDSGVNVYRYQFTKENGYYGTYHSGEIIYAYGNIYKSNHQFAYNDSDRALSDTMVKCWTNFVKTGDPGTDSLEYPEYTENGKIMEFGENVGLIEDRYLDLYPIIEEYLLTKTAEKQ
jgi:para-nitrobenzyl esterase